MNTEFKKLDKCLACNGENLYNYLDLGSQPLANDLKENLSDSRSLYPLKLNVCKDCWHSQLSIAVNPSLLYKNYLYVSGTSQTLNKFFEDLVEKKTQELGVGKVLDIACNDGTFLQKFKNKGWETYGIDPAENLRYLCEQKGINIQTSFFAGEGYTRPTERFDLITCFNVLAHIPNPAEFLIEASELLSDNGEILIQTSQKDMVVEGQFDTVYHEHHSFFSLSSFLSIAKRANLFLKEIKYTEIHGGSYLISFSKKEIKLSDKIESKNLNEISKERVEGRYDIELYKNYTNKVNNSRDEIRTIVANLRDEGNKIIGFGAAAKGIVLLNYFDLNLDYVIDENKLKVNKYIAGTDTLVSDYPESIDGKVCFVILAWNFYDEIVKKIKIRYPKLDCYFLRVFPEISLTK